MGVRRPALITFSGPFTRVWVPTSCWFFFCRIQRPIRGRQGTIRTVQGRGQLELHWPRLDPGAVSGQNLRILRILAPGCHIASKPAVDSWTYDDLRKVASADRALRRKLEGQPDARPLGRMWSLCRLRVSISQSLEAPESNKSKNRQPRRRASRSCGCLKSLFMGI